MNQFKLLVIIIFAFIVAVFSVSNSGNVASIRFFNWTLVPEISMVIVVLGSILLGVLITAVLGFVSQTKLKKMISKLTRENTSSKEKEEKLQLKIRELEERLEDSGIKVSEDKNFEKETDHK
jgi:uncharacterized integral membrane protein